MRRSSGDCPSSKKPKAHARLPPVLSFAVPAPHKTKAKPRPREVRWRPDPAKAPSYLQGKHWDSIEDVKMGAEEGSSGDSFRVYSGHTAMSWALLASILKTKEPGYCVVAYDLRGHGATRTRDDTNMAIDQLVKDTVDVLSQKIAEGTPIILVGHSMGGSLAVKVAITGKLRVIGLVIVDVVEGTALAALPSMTQVVRQRPKAFASEVAAVDWAIRSTWLSNRTSALLSMPSQLRREVAALPEGLPCFSSEKKDSAKIEMKERYVWRTDLLQSERHWKGWFQGMTGEFLSLKPPKVLVLAGRDRMAMDNKLTIAQMQGKFQMVFMQKCGHSIQEDKPEELAEVMDKFARRISKFLQPSAQR